MKPCGTILTYMSRQDWKGKSNWIKLRTIFFNAILFVLQLAFLVAGTAIGKIKWPKAPPVIRVLSVIGLIFALIGVIASAAAHIEIVFFINLIPIFPLIASYRGIDWRKVWRAAQCSHVRLVLEKVPDDVLMPINSYWTANFGYPEMEIQSWIEKWNDGKRFKYYDPTFEPSSEFIAAMIQYAHDQVGKRYDDYQLASPMLNFPIWVFWWPLWGKEVIGWFNRPGGLEFCSSGVTACLRWGEGAPRRVKTRFFKVYHTAMVQPCLFAIDKNWREVKAMGIQPDKPWPRS